MKNINSILIVEDHHLMRLALIEEIKSLMPNSLILGANDIKTALNIIKAQPVQLIITDPGLPGFDPTCDVSPA
jgi:DNA-binding NarL/FixJ family response regulator